MLVSNGILMFLAYHKVLKRISPRLFDSRAKKAGRMPEAHLQDF